MEQKTTINEGMFAFLAAFLVLLSAMLDLTVAVTIAVGFLLTLGIVRITTE